jgi:hypothetical protein
LKGGEKRREKLIFREYVEDVPLVWHVEESWRESQQSIPKELINLKSTQGPLPSKLQQLNTMMAISSVACALGPRVNYKYLSFNFVGFLLNFLL